MSAIYLSYGREDKPLAEKLAKALSSAGVDIWHDPPETPNRQSFPKYFDIALKTCKVLLLLWSKAARRSSLVERDWTSALIFDKKIVSLVLDDTAIPAALLHGNLLDFRDARRSWRLLLGSLHARNGTGDSMALAKYFGTFCAGAERNGTRNTPDLKRFRRTDVIKLRSQPSQRLSIEAVEQMLLRCDFFDNTWRNRGRGVLHYYEAVEQYGDRVVIDHKTGLMWQHGGSKGWMMFNEAQKYVAELNKSYHAGYIDWRLPTLEEAMSLVEPFKAENDLHINPVFAPEQRYLWCADKQSSEVIWFVAFPNGGLGSCRASNFNHVRAVRKYA